MDEARKLLQRACRVRNLDDLKAALQNGEAAGLCEADLDAGRVALAEESRKQHARVDLEVAVASRDVGHMRAAIQEATRNRLPIKEIDAARKLLLAEESKLAARKAIRDAIEEPEIKSLRAAIKQCMTHCPDYEALPRARQILAEEEKKAAARSRLEKAAQNREMKELRLAINEGEKAYLGSDDEILQRARRVLAEEERKCEIRARLAAVGDDVQCLRSLIEEAEIAGLTSEVEAARLKLAHLLKQASVREALGQAVQSKNVDDLRILISEGTAIGLTTELTEARRVLSSEEWKVRCRSLLAEACLSRDGAALQRALSEGEAAGLDGVELEDARRALSEEMRKDRCRQTLSVALAGGDMDALRAALSDAEAAGLSNDELRAAKHAVEAEDQTLATRLQQKVDARDRLQSAIDSQDEETLRMAISAGRAAGLSEEELAAAIRALEASQERACNLQELRDAMASRDGDRMRSSIDKAKRLGLPDDIVRDACQELERLDQAEAARKDVVEAMRSRDIERLRETISAASAAGVDQEVLTTARKLLDELEVQAAARQSLADAMRAGDAHKLRSAICAAEAAGLLDDELHDAREALANCVLSDAANCAAEESKRLARDALRRALESQDEKALQTALNAGRVAGLSEDELGDAARSLAQLEERARALQELRDSVGSGDRGRVRSAIDDAIRVGLPDDFVNAARQALNEMNETEASKERTVEAKSRDEARCEDEDASVEQQSHRNDLELQAVSSHLGLPETQAECEPKFDIETRTEINDKASYMWKATSLDAMADNLIIDHLRTRLCKLHTSASTALAACTRSPSIDSPHNDAALPKVDSSVLRAFAEQLQYNMSEQRAQQFMNNASQDGEMLVADFLRLFDKQKMDCQAPQAPRPDRNSRKVELQQQKTPDKEKLEKVRSLHVTRLVERERSMVTSLREALFERRSSMQRMFKSVDLNDDGLVTLEEFTYALESSGTALGHEIDRGKVDVGEEEAARIMAFFDREKNGNLNLSAFMRLLQGSLLEPGHTVRIPEKSRVQTQSRNVGSMSRVRAAVDHAAGFEAAFRLWDINQDGVISIEELQHFLKSLDVRFTTEEVRSLFLAADVNKDGRIDYQEFIQWVFGNRQV